MKRTEMTYALKRLGVVPVLLGLATLPMHAQTPDAIPECATSDFKGHYALQVSGFGSPFPTRSSIVGFVYADGEGFITMWKNWIVVVPAGEETGRVLVGDDVARAESVGSSIQYTVEPDCSMMVTALFPSMDGPIRRTVSGVIFNGGREAYWNQTEPANSAGGNITLKRTDAFGEELQAKVDALSAKVGVIMRWLGIPSPR